MCLPFRLRQRRAVRRERASRDTWGAASSGRPRPARARRTHRERPASRSAQVPVRNLACSSRVSCMDSALSIALPSAARALRIAVSSFATSFAASTCGCVGDAGGLGVRRRLGQRTGVGVSGRQHHGVHHLAHGVRFDEDVLHVALEPHVEARLEFLLGEDAQSGEELARLRGHELRQGFRRPAEIGQAALLGFPYPGVGVVVAFEADVPGGAEYGAHHLEHGVVHLLRLLELGAQRGGEFVERLGDGCVEQAHRERDGGRRADGAEFELVARERERRRAVAVGVVLLDVGQLGHAELDHGLLGAARPSCRRRCSRSPG